MMEKLIRDSLLCRDEVELARSMDVVGRDQALFFSAGVVKICVPSSADDQFSHEAKPSQIGPGHHHGLSFGHSFAITRSKTVN